MSKARLCLVLVFALIAVSGRIADAETQEKKAGRSADAADGTTPLRGSDPLELDGVLDDLLLTPEAYYYESLGRRDPFVSLISPEYREMNPPAHPESDELTVVGILWGENDRFALVETADGRSRLLREGSTIGDGIVVQVHPDRIVVHITKFGTSRTVTLPVVQGGSFHESPRPRRR